MINSFKKTRNEHIAVKIAYAQQEQQMKESYEKFTNLLVVKQLQTEVPEKKTELEAVQRFRKDGKKQGKEKKSEDDEEIEDEVNEQAIQTA